VPSSVNLSLTPVEVDAASARAVKRAGAVILALSDAGAPTEPDPRHGIHMTETGFVKVIEAGLGGATAEIGYEAWWAIRQHEDMEYHHPHGGTAKFLELAVLEGKDAALAIMASDIRAALGE
jgi:hypothetical protein